MPGKAAKITVTERQHEILLTLRNAITAPSHLRQRAAVILLAFDGLRNEDIAEKLGLGRRQVGRWRRRWANAWSGLIDLECRETKADLRRAIEAVLTDAPRPGAPGKFTPEQVTQILAVACEPPAKSDLHLIKPPLSQCLIPDPGRMDIGDQDLKTDNLLHDDVCSADLHERESAMSFHSRRRSRPSAQTTHRPRGGTCRERTRPRIAQMRSLSTGI